MIDWPVAVPSFLTALAEWVEAFTIVLAVSLGIGWRGAIGAAVNQNHRHARVHPLSRQRLHPGHAGRRCSPAVPARRGAGLRHGRP